MTKSTNFNYYEADNVYGALFFQFPKVLMYGEQYKHLSSDAKLAYMVLKDRLEYSLRNNWVDEEGHVYFTFTNQELENLFNCHNQKVVKIKKEADKKGKKDLLIQVDGGITTDNVMEPIKAGANVIVAGSAVYKGDIEENIKTFKEKFHSFS